MWLRVPAYITLADCRQRQNIFLRFTRTQIPVRKSTTSWMEPFHLIAISRQASLIIMPRLWVLVVNNLRMLSTPSSRQATRQIIATVNCGIFCRRPTRTQTTAATSSYFIPTDLAPKMLMAAVMMNGIASIPGSIPMALIIIYPVIPTCTIFVPAIRM